jgi:hypothetical protein
MRLTRALRLYISATVAVAAVVLVVAWLRHPEPPHGLQWYYTIILTALVVLERQFPLSVSRKTKIIADAPATIAAGGLLPAPLAIGACMLDKKSSGPGHLTPAPGPERLQQQRSGNFSRTRRVRLQWP